MPTIALALGSNIDAERNLRAAAEMLRARWPGIRFSSIYRTAAMGMEEQDDFLNAVAVLDANDSVTEIREACRTIEHALKKDIAFRWGPRTIDLDLLLSGNDVLPDRTAWNRAVAGETVDGTVVPHPRLHMRRFVLDPLTEILPGGHHPVLRKTWEALRADVAGQRIERLRMRI